MGVIIAGMIGLATWGVGIGWSIACGTGLAGPGMCEAGASGPEWDAR